nr:MAG TPA: hypothetical protein [Crassvirales sp.]
MLYYMDFSCICRNKLNICDIITHILFSSIICFKYKFKFSMLYFRTLFM